jgi:hypothetical protein
MTDPLFIHFDQLDALLVARAADEAPGDEEQQRKAIGWGWFRLVTEPNFRQECLESIA